MRYLWSDFLERAAFGSKLWWNSWWNFRFFPSLCRWFRHNSSVESCWNTQFILIAVTLLLNILLSCAFVTSLNCLVICWRPWWFECYIRRSSWIHCWLLLAVLSDHFFHLVTSTFLLCKFRGLPGSNPVSFPVMRRWKCLGMKRSSQPSSTTPGKRAGTRNMLNRKPKWSR